MRVVATEVGYFGQYREIGDQFEVPDDTKKASWFEPVSKAALSKVADLRLADKGPEPKGLSQLKTEESLV